MKDEQKYPGDRQMMWRGILIIGGGALFAHVIFPLIWWNFMGGSSYQGQPYDMQTLPEGYRVVRPTPTLTPTVTLTSTETRDGRPQTRDDRPQTRDGRPQTRDGRPQTRDDSQSFISMETCKVTGQWSPVSSQPSAVNRLRSTVCGQPSAVNRLRSTVCGQPSAVNWLPIASSPFPSPERILNDR